MQPGRESFKSPDAMIDLAAEPVLVALRNAGVKIDPGHSSELVASVKGWRPDRKAIAFRIGSERKDLLVYDAKKGTIMSVDEIPQGWIIRGCKYLPFTPKRRLMDGARND